MRAVVSAFNLSLNNYQARTENEIGLSFSIQDGTRLKLNEVLEVDLVTLVASQCVTRVSTGQVVAIRLGAHDLHDLRLPSGHGMSRTPNEERKSAA